MATKLIALVLFQLPTIYAIDPCLPGNHDLFPRAKYRGGLCEFNFDKPECDIQLNMGWYKAQGIDGPLKLADQPVEVAKCGTNHPWWMNGSHPTVDEGEVTREICLVSLESCADTGTVIVKNCTEFYVYHLSSVEACDQAYCFGQNDPCPPFDPCDSVWENVELTVEASRSWQCNSTQDLNDDSALNQTWYRLVSAGTSQHVAIPRACPGTNTCGATTQIWASDSLSVTDGVTNITMCVRSDNECCPETFVIQAKNCTDFMVYELKETQPLQGYCTDELVTCFGPDATTTETTITAESTTRGSAVQVLYPGSTYRCLVFATLMFYFTFY